jgi:hypothetical protein
MSTGTAPEVPAAFDEVPEEGARRTARAGVRRISTETKASFKTTEFFAMVALVAGILISAAVISAKNGHPDRFVASQAWLYVAIVGAGYMIARGLAKAGSRDFYDDRG